MGYCGSRRLRKIATTIVSSYQLFPSLFFGGQEFSII
ncbi:unnamed protein product [Callosobruchus maculatus]|uniref:Uncharacterized protein n=1 Tax=Callosobruchus maculatus TaxID=64391 RepID=A0A653D0U6_CALMS|nr:unnamed protein product [Callosobruchus maculatus]